MHAGELPRGRERRRQSPLGDLEIAPGDGERGALHEEPEIRRGRSRTLGVLADLCDHGPDGSMFAELPQNVDVRGGDVRPQPELSPGPAQQLESSVLLQQSGRRSGADQVGARAASWRAHVIGGQGVLGRYQQRPEVRGLVVERALQEERGLLLPSGCPFFVGKLDIGRLQRFAIGADQLGGKLQLEMEVAGIGAHHRAEAIERGGGTGGPAPPAGRRCRVRSPQARRNRSSASVRRSASILRWPRIPSAAALSGSAFKMVVAEGPQVTPLAVAPASGCLGNFPNPRQLCECSQICSRPVVEA